MRLPQDSHTSKQQWALNMCSKWWSSLGLSMDLYRASSPVRFKIVLGPAIISWMDELIRSLHSSIRMPPYDASAFPSAICDLGKLERRVFKRKSNCKNLSIMKLACVVLGKKGRRGGVCVCLCAYLKVLTSASRAREQHLSHSKGRDSVQEGRAREEDRWKQICKISEDKETVKTT